MDAIEAHEYVTATTLCELIEGTTARSWANLRTRGGGPPYTHVGGRVRYRLADVRAWLDANTVSAG